MIKKTLATIFFVIVFFIAFFSQASAERYQHANSKIPDLTQTLVPITNDVKPASVVLSGIVNVSHLPNIINTYYLEMTHPPLPRDYQSYQNYEEMLKSGKVPLDRIPVAPNTPLVSQPRPGTLSVLPTEFAGFEQNMTNQPYPPDVQVASGSGHVMEMVNLEGGIWTKAGVPVRQFPLDKFFSLSPDHLISDPRIIYDGQSGRWFAELLDQTNSTISVAVSQTGDPEGNWNIYKIEYSGPCIDFPRIGTSDDKVVISTNDFSSGCQDFTDSEMVVLDKSQMVSHSSYVGSSDLTDSNFSVTPARSLGPTRPLFLVANNPSDIGDNVAVYKITGPAEYAQVSSNFTTTGAMQADAPSIPQNGTSVLVATPPHGFEDAVWSDGKIWSAFTDACRPAEGFAKRVYSCIHLLGYNTTTGSSLDFEIANSDYNFSYPAVTVDGRGAMYITFNGVSYRSYPSLYATGQTRYDLPNSVEPMKEIATGSSYDTSCRYGDYFGASPDPSDPERAWIAGEFHHLKNTFLLASPCGASFSSPAWSTMVAEVTLWNSTGNSGRVLP